MAILTDLKDPRVSDVTVTFVEVSGDMRLAKVHVSVMGDEKKQNLCLIGLQNSAGFLQSKIGRRIDTRYTPRIKFELDKGMQNAMLVTRILEEVLPPAEETEIDAESNPNENLGLGAATNSEAETNSETEIKTDSDSSSTDAVTSLPASNEEPGVDNSGVEDGVDSLSSKQDQ